jgi:FKBP-type peptidyl-prolyl cis-trans isomerase
MRIALKLLLAAGFGVAMLQLPIQAADDKPAFKDDKEKASYAVGFFFGNQIKSGNLDLDLDVMTASIKDVLADRELKLTRQQASEAINAYQVNSNRKKGDAFLAENKTKEGVKTKIITLADGKTAELQYKVIKTGTGDTPKPTDRVSVNYRGTLVNGQEFDNSAKHGNQPAKFPVTGVVRGWTEALEMMQVGSKWELYLPPALAYGDTGRQGIPPASTLIFEMELVGTEAPPPPAPAAQAAPAVQQPLTSDIIKVPSAEELKKGAKIEVIKAEDAAKQAQAQGTNADKKQ